MAESNQYQKEIEALGVVFGAIGSLDEQGQQFVLQTVSSRLGLRPPQTGVSPAPEKAKPDGQSLTAPMFRHVANSTLADPEKDPKHFVDEKHPTTDVERVICLAYFWAHHREQRHFKTADISKLNTEAAQPDLSNPSQSMKQATDKSLLANSKKKGEKQLSTYGEKYVCALPHRDAVKEVDESENKRRRRKPSSNKTAKKKA